MCNNFRDFSRIIKDYVEGKFRDLSYPNDGLANFFFISFCVSRKNNAYGETGLIKKDIEISIYSIYFTFEVHLDLFVSFLVVSFFS